MFTSSDWWWSSTTWLSFSTIITYLYRSTSQPSSSNWGWFHVRNQGIMVMFKELCVEYVIDLDVCGNSESGRHCFFLLRDVQWHNLLKLNLLQGSVIKFWIEVFLRCQQYIPYSVAFARVLSSSPWFVVLSMGLTKGLGDVTPHVLHHHIQAP